MSKSVYNKLTDEVGGQKAPLSLHACKSGTRITDSEIININTLGKEFKKKISNKSDKNCSDNHNINLHSLINNRMIIQ